MPNPTGDDLKPLTFRPVGKTGPDAPPVASLGSAAPDSVRLDLRRLLADPAGRLKLRRLLAAEFPGTDVARLSDDQMLVRLAPRIAHGRVAMPGAAPATRRLSHVARDVVEKAEKPAPKAPPEKAKREPEPEKLLTVIRCDDRFAPGAESLEVAYEIKGLAKEKVLVEVTSPHYAGGPIYRRELTDAEKSDGTHTLLWGGKSSATSGDLKDRYIHPLLSPYKVHIYKDGTYTGDREFKVLYHSIEIVKGPWTPDEKEPPEADEKAWVQYKLNELGYYGGPVGKDTENYLKKAILRYKANHKSLRETFYPNYKDKISSELKAALKAGDGVRPALALDAITDATKTTVIAVEALTYERLSRSKDEFGQERVTNEKARLVRPLIPLEVRIFIKSKTNVKTDAPDAVGPVRVNWRFVDADEDLSLQVPDTATEPSKTRAYIEKALKLKGGRASNGDNCPEPLGGLRTKGAPDSVSVFLKGSSYVPYEAHHDSGQKVMYTAACVDKAKFPKRVGRAGALFRPSYIAGDDYQLRAELDFTDLKNKAALEKFHGVTDQASRLHAGTGVFRIRRFNRIAAVIDWPARTNSEDWVEIAAEFAKCYCDVDTTTFVRKKITDVLTEAEFRALVTANTPHKNPSKISLKDTSVYGLPLKAQGNLNARTYRTALKTRTWTNFGDPIQSLLGDKLSAKIRKDQPTGFIICNFLAHPPVDIETDPKNGNTTVLPANRQYVTWGGSIGLPDSVVLADQKDPDKVYYVIAHEMGHNFYLLHWENTGENNLKHHDRADHNCIMSYSTDSRRYPYQAQGVYTPHFCGKCNLKLRGWNILESAMPNQSP